VTKVDLIAGEIVAERRVILAGPFKVRYERRTHTIVASATIENQGLLAWFCRFHSSLTRTRISFPAVPWLKSHG
jgi:hypothetical protein